MKTLDDLRRYALYGAFINTDELRASAVEQFKRVKFCEKQNGKNYSASEWIKYFFNLEEDDLK